MGRLTGHTSTQRGKRVRIILKDGRKLITKFIKKVRNIVSTEAGDFPASELKVFAIYKPQAHEREQDQ